MDTSIKYSEQITDIKELFDTREAVYLEITQDIADVISPTVLEALYTLFDVPSDDVRWLDFRSTDNLLIVTCSITYNPSVTIPQFILDTTDKVEYSSDRIEQTVRVGIPYELVMEPPEDIIAFITALIESHKNGGPSLIEHMSTDTVIDNGGNRTSNHNDDVFDPSTLSPTQRQQLLFFQHETKDKIH